jgi:hypothetical protein
VELSGAPVWPTNCSSSTPTRFPSIFVWESGTYALYMRLWCYVTRDAGTTTGKIDLVDGTRGNLAATITINNDSLGVGVLSAWLVVDLPIVGPNTLVPTLTRTSGSGTVSWHGASGWWNGPSHDLGTLAWQPISQAWAAAQKPLDAYVLRRLVEQATYLTANYPRPVVQKWWGTGMYAYAGAGGVEVAVIGRYKVPFGARCPDVDFAVHARGDLLGGGTNQPKLRVKVNGVQVGTDITTTAAWAWYTRTYTYGLTTENVYEVTLEAVFDATNMVSDATRIASFCGYEASTALTAAQLGLPGSDTVPASWSQLQYGKIGARTPIYADKNADGTPVGLAQLVKDMIFLHANRRRRNLVADGTRWAGHVNNDWRSADYALSAPGAANDSRINAIYRWGTTPDLARFIFFPGPGHSEYHAHYCAWLGRTIPVAAWGENLTGGVFLGYGVVSSVWSGGRVYGGAAKYPDLAWGKVADNAFGPGFSGDVLSATPTSVGVSPEPVGTAGFSRDPQYGGQATREKHSDDVLFYS